MFVIGHTLVWHSQIPRWVFQDAEGKPLTRDALLARMHDHIATVVGRYKGRIKGWDVVNEALNEDGTLRASPWRTIIGDDYHRQGIPVRARSRSRCGAVLQRLQPRGRGEAERRRRAGEEAQGGRAFTITAVGSQTHDKLDLAESGEARHDDRSAWRRWGEGQHHGARRRRASAGDAEPHGRRERERAAAGGREPGQPVYRRAAGLGPAGARRSATPICSRCSSSTASVIDRVTFWGVGDGDSWLNNWPMRGRTSYPLLFDRQDLPKPAFEAVMNVARQARAGSK